MEKNKIIGISGTELADQVWARVVDLKMKEEFQKAALARLSERVIKDGKFDPGSDPLDLVIEFAWKQGFTDALEGVSAGAIEPLSSVPSKQSLN